ncbi:MAG: DUF2460 domain-containing protein [Rhodocyclaceae bacterium]|nr:DUF2460 domain-containing protein [Rhodocyclaceae bacterium]
MSDLLLPSLPGLAWSVLKTPEWSTSAQRSVSGKELRLPNWSYPIWHFALTYEVLRADAVNTELQTLMGFFCARQGSFDTFLFNDPTDNAVTAQPLGTGDGATKSFQLVRQMAGFVEPVKELNGAPQLFVNGVATSAFSLGTGGVVTFNTAPANGAALTWSGNFYFRVHFEKDLAEFENFLYQLWALKKLEIASVK